MRKLLIYIMIIPVKIYQYVLSPLFMPSCRFIPSCSQYTIEALKKHGPFRGTYFSMKRILSCHPWGGHGHDPVPSEKKSKSV